MYQAYQNKSKNSKIKDERRRERCVELTKKRINDLGVYYLYFICVFLKKAFNAFRGTTLSSQQNIEFADILPQDFRDACDNVEVFRTSVPYKAITHDEVGINICERFTAYVKNICFNVEAQESKRYGYDLLRGNIFEEIKYLCNFYFDAVITVQNVNIEPVLDYFSKTVGDIKCALSNNNVSISTQFAVDLPSLEATEITNKFPPPKNQNNYNRNNQNHYQKKRPDDNEAKYNNEVEYSNRIGFGLLNSVLVPHLEKLDMLAKTDYSFVLENANFYISWFYQTLQHEYLLTRINEMLKIKDMEGVEKFCENNVFSNFVSMSDMENLLNQ